MYDDPILRERSVAEWQGWQDLCNTLVKTGAVTAADLKRSISDTSTPGGDVFEAIRYWGRQLVLFHERAGTRPLIGGAQDGD